MVVANLSFMDFVINLGPAVQEKYLLFKSYKYALDLFMKELTIE